MNESILLSLALILAVSLTLIFLLSRSMRRLQKHVLLLEQVVSRHSKDLAGLCSAAVNVDQRISGSDQQVRELAAMMSTRDAEIESGTSGPVQSYQDAITKIQQGATIEELVQDCGLSHEEARLLSRLHSR